MMRTGHKIIFVIAAVFFFSSCGEHESLLECASPDGKHIATFYRYYGGGAAGFQFEQLNIRKAGENIDYYSYVFQMHHGYDARMTWTDNEHLLFEYPEDAVVKKNKTEAALSDGKIEITYATKASRSGSFISDKTGCGTK